MDSSLIGKLLVIAGITSVAAGIFLILGLKVPWLGRLPGDILVGRPGFALFVPVATMLLISVVLTILVNVILRLLK